jgi:hypothetical protein
VISPQGLLRGPSKPSVKLSIPSSKPLLSPITLSTPRSKPFCASSMTASLTRFSRARRRDIDVPGAILIDLRETSSPPFWCVLHQAWTCRFGTAGFSFAIRKRRTCPPNLILESAAFSMLWTASGHEGTVNGRVVSVNDSQGALSNALPDQKITCNSWRFIADVHIRNSTKSARHGGPREAGHLSKTLGRLGTPSHRLLASRSILEARPCPTRHMSKLVA